MPGCQNKEEVKLVVIHKTRPVPPFTSFFSDAASRSFTPSDSAAAAECIVHAQCPKQMAEEDTGQTKGGLGFFA